MKQPQISVIVPIYESERFLRRCLDSILNQTINEWECILVDDGSKDNSGQICDEYALKDNRFIVIHKKNEGVSSARQAGLVAATGDFVIHVDSDDSLDKSAFEELLRYQKKTGAELIIFDFYRVTNGKKVRTTQEPSGINHKQVLKDVISGNLYGCCWNKLIMRSAIKRWGASFPKGINLGEDKCFLASLLKNPVKISYLPKPLYNYDVSINDNSLVRKISKDSMRSGFMMVAYLEKCLDIEYSQSINVVKRNLKIRAITSGLYKDKEIRLMFKEINLQVIKKIITLKTHSINDLALFLFSIRLYPIAKYLLRIRRI